MEQERKRILDLIQSKVDFCKENQQEMYACMLLQLSKEIERLPVTPTEQWGNLVSTEFELNANMT